MRTISKHSTFSLLLSIAASCLALISATASPSTFQLRTRCNMTGTDSGPHGWASTVYNHSGGRTNQSLQISCHGLATNHVYHLMASWGTNGQLMHVSDFICNRSGAILMQHIGGATRHFVGTNNPYPAWNIACDWENHMSGVIFPGLSTNWCYPMHDHRLVAPLSMMGGDMGGGMGDQDHMGDHHGGLSTTNYTGGSSDGMMCGWDDHGGWNDHTGATNYGGMDDMCHGWPGSTNWWAGATNWWPTMNSWCWDYTNSWNSGSISNDLWCSWHRSGTHSMPLPPCINPVPVLNGLIITDDSLQPVLTCDLATPDSFTYYARCDFTNHGVVAGAKCTLQATATKRATRFSLNATGLAPSTTYFLDFDGANVAPVATDRYGRLQVRKLPTGVMSMRGIGHVSIEDRHYNALLSATLPPH